jgi:hypothetical protein
MWSKGAPSESEGLGVRLLPPKDQLIDFGGVDRLTSGPPAAGNVGRRDPLDKVVRLGLPPKDWMVDLTNALDMPLGAALEEVGEAAKTLAAGKGSVIAALALWLADVVLAHRLQCPAPVPLITGQIRRSDVRAAARQDADGAWHTTWTLAYARAAAAGADSTPSSRGGRTNS